MAMRSKEHPLKAPVQWAIAGREYFREHVADYSAVLQKREYVDGEMVGPQYMFVKIRQRPFSVYMRFLKPDELRGQEVLYIEGRNSGKMFAHGVGIKRIFGTLLIDPEGARAMAGNRHPLTQIGIENMLNRIIEVASADMKYAECTVEYFPGSMINGRSSLCIEVTHPQRRSNFIFHVARIYVDDVLNIPVRYEAYDWPKQPGGEPQLLECYTYLDVKLNAGFTAKDFDTRNSDYDF